MEMSKKDIRKMITRELAGRSSKEDSSALRSLELAHMWRAELLEMYDELCVKHVRENAYHARVMAQIEEMEEPRKSIETEREMVRYRARKISHQDYQRALEAQLAEAKELTAK